MKGFKSTSTNPYTYTQSGVWKKGQYTHQVDMSYTNGRWGSLRKFQDLFDSNEYLRKVLSQTRSNVYYINVDDHTEIVRLLKSRIIDYVISDE